MLKKTFAALGVAAITMLATPVAALAVTPADARCGTGPANYAQSGVVTADRAVVSAGGTVTVSWQEGYFTPGEAVYVGTSGAAASGSAIGSSGSGSIQGAADANGALAVNVRVPSSATGALAVQAFSDSACGGVTVNVAGTRSASSSSLAATGGSSAPVVLVVSGAGALAFGSILLLARARGRRNIQE